MKSKTPPTKELSSSAKKRRLEAEKDIHSFRKRPALPPLDYSTIYPPPKRKEICFYFLKDEKNSEN